MPRNQSEKCRARASDRRARRPLAPGAPPPYAPWHARRRPRVAAEPPSAARRSLGRLRADRQRRRPQAGALRRASRVVRPEPQCLWAPGAGRRGLGRGRRGVRARRRGGRRPLALQRRAAGDLAARAGATCRSSAGSPPSATWLLPRAGGELGLAGRARVARRGRPRGAEPVRLYRRRQPGLRAAGAAVTHVDASKKAVGWARENAELSGLGRPADPLDLRGRPQVCAARGAARLAATKGSSSIRRNTAAGRTARSGGCSRTCRSLIAGCAALLARRRRLPAAQRLCRAASPAWRSPACSPTRWTAAAGASTGASWRWCEEDGARGSACRFFARWSGVSEPRHHLADQPDGQGGARPAPAQGARGERPVPRRGAEDRHRGGASCGHAPRILMLRRRGGRPPAAAPRPPPRWPPTAR